MANEDHTHTLALKKKLRELVNSVVDGDDFSVNAADDAITALSALRNLKFTSSFSRKFDDIPVPPQFRCPLSGQLMTDPVILANGLTYDRVFIQKWLHEVHRICPQTHQVLSHFTIAPNYLVRHMISRWSQEQGIDLPKPVENTDDNGGEVTEAHRCRLPVLLQKLSSSSPIHQKEAAREIRQLTKRMPSFMDSQVIKKLLTPISSGTASVDPQLHEDLIAAVLNLSINDDNKRSFAADTLAISLLIESLKSGTIQTRSNAAAAIFSLSSLDSNKHIIGNSGAIKYLVDLLEKGHPSAMKDASSALFNLCILDDNKERTVREGAIQVILAKIKDHVLVDELLALLELLSCHSKGVQALGSHGAVPFLLQILRENVSEHSKENCVAIVHTMYFSDKTARKQVEDDDVAHSTLSKLAKSGTSRAKRKASGILEKLDLAQWHMV